MTDPITFHSKSARFGLPFIFSGQAQKEFYLNEAFALVDTLLNPVVEGTANTPPTAPAEGSCWIVDANPTDAWTGHAGQIACLQADSWLFAVPMEGMRVFDRTTGADLRYSNGWQQPAPVALPAGGATADPEARAALTDLIRALADLGLIRQSG